MQKLNEYVKVTEAASILGVSHNAGRRMGGYQTFAGTSERAMTVLPVLLIAQAIFSGGLARLEGPVKVFAQLVAPAYWSLDGIRATFGSASATPPTRSPWSFSAAILGPGGPLLLI